jgi:hypothetical protein
MALLGVRHLIRGPSAVSAWANNVLWPGHSVEQSAVLGTLPAFWRQVTGAPPSDSVSFVHK